LRSSQLDRHTFAFEYPISYRFRSTEAEFCVGLQGVRHADLSQAVAPPCDDYLGHGNSLLTMEGCGRLAPEVEVWSDAAPEPIDEVLIHVLELVRDVEAHDALAGQLGTELLLQPGDVPL